MEILLTEDIAGVGDIGQTVRVRPGYARNYLIPKGFAIEANTGNSKAIAHELKQLEIKKQKLKIQAEEEAKKWNTLTVKTELKVAGKGKVFGSITNRDIADLLKKQEGLEIDRRRILLSEPIKTLGEHSIPVKLHAEVQTYFTLQIEKAEASEKDVQQAVEKTRQDFAEAAAEDEEE